MQYQYWVTILNVHLFAVQTVQIYSEIEHDKVTKNGALRNVDNFKRNIVPKIIYQQMPLGDL